MAPELTRNSSAKARVKHNDNRHPNVMDTCKICGAPRDPMAANCKFCSTAYTLEKVTGETYINALQCIINKTTSENAAAVARGNSGVGALLSVGALMARTAGADRIVASISMFSMPADIENLMQFFAFCHGNAQITVSFQDDVGETIKGAWYGKSKMAYSQLKLKALRNPEIAAYISDYESVYGVSAKPQMSSKVKVLLANAAFMIVLFIIMLVVMVLDKK
jgi:hypothetical protein